MTGERFAAELVDAEDRLRSLGLSGRNAFAALCRHLSDRLGIEETLWLEGPEAPSAAKLERIPLTAELDLFGLAYERFFPDVFKAERGQYFTPRPLVELMADLAEIRPNARVLDPTCGSGAFLVAALSRGAVVDGIEIDPELVALSRINLVLHGGKARDVRRGDLFREVEGDERWDVILANPPFSVDVVDEGALRLFSLTGERRRLSSDVLFLEAAWRRLRPGGRLVALLPRSLLTNAGNQWVRDWLNQRFVKKAVVSLPEGVFRPFGGAASRASIVSLAKRPAQLTPWVAEHIDHPGYDVRSLTFKRREPDEVGMLRLALRAGCVRTLPAHYEGWLPEAELQDDGIAEGVPRVGLTELAPREDRRVVPSRDPDGAFTEIDLKDVDKTLGEVVTARAQPGKQIRGSKASFDEGDLVFARIRPALNNVALVDRPAADLPDHLCGSAEWIRLVPAEQPGFALVAARSSFVRAQLARTEGQTRPRIRPEDLDDVDVPSPGDEVRIAMDSLVLKARQARLQARRALEEVHALYEAYGSGELSESELMRRLQALSSESGF